MSSKDSLNGIYLRLEKKGANLDFLEFLRDVLNRLDASAQAFKYASLKAPRRKKAPSAPVVSAGSSILPMLLEDDTWIDAWIEDQIGHTETWTQGKRGKATEGCRSNNKRCRIRHGAFQPLAF